MAVGETVYFHNGHYDIRAIVDGRFVVRRRDDVLGKETYEVWTQEEREKFDVGKELREDQRERNEQIYERRLAGDKVRVLAEEFGISQSRVRDIYSKQELKERRQNASPGR